MSNNNDITVIKTEPIWTYQAKLQKLSDRLDETEKSLEEKITKSQSLSLNTISLIKSDVAKDISQHLRVFESHMEEFKTLKNVMENNIDKLKSDIVNSINSSKLVFKQILLNGHL